VIYYAVRKKNGTLYGNGQNHINLYTDKSFAKSKATRIKGTIEEFTLLEYKGPDWR
jgi:hypothetical protein